VTFDADTALAPVGDGHWRGAVPPTWSIGTGPNGGFMAALAARAALQAAGAPPRSLTLHYLAPPAEAEIDVATEIVRAGRSATFLRVSMTQEGKPVVLALAVCGAWYDDAPSWSDLGPPQLPPMDECILVDPSRTGVPPLQGRYETYLAPRDPADRPIRVDGYIRTRDPHVVDQVVLAAISDAFIPPAFFRTREAILVPTLELTVHFRGLPPDDPHPFVRQTTVSRLAAGGVVEVDGEIWSEDDRLLVQSRQLALMRRLQGGPPRHGPGTNDRASAPLG
jgi:acyl-CoA thioesterase